MKRLVTCLICLPALVRAQTLELGGGPAAPAPAPALSADAGQNCMNVTAGTSVAYGCINAGQKELVRQHQATLATTVPNAGSAAPTLGLFNQAATREHLGTSFGHSTVPQAVPPPHFANPLLPPPK